MALMIPQLNQDQLDAIQSPAEATLYVSFRDRLPDGFEVYHSVGWILKRNESMARDGETDFVICHPDHGFLTIEVKGGGIGYDAYSDKWHSVDGRARKHEIKDPVRQALGAKYSILNKLQEHPRWYQIGRGRVLCGHAVFFPDIGNPARTQKPDLPMTIIGSSANLDDPAKWVTSVFDYWRGESEQTDPLSKSGMRLFSEIFGRSFSVRPLLSKTLSQEEAKRIKLTSEQARILDTLRSRRRAAISGGAGTGKTLLGVDKATRLAKEGFSTLLTCYNRPLADHLAEVCGGTDGLEVMSYHQLCTRFIASADRESGRDLLREAEKTYPGKDLWSVQYPAALSYALDVIEDRYDAIVCDEGQDFEEDFWFPIEMLLSDHTNSPLYIFFDENQNIYSRAASFPIEDIFYLTVNCRNTSQIHAAAYNYYQGNPVSPPDLIGQDINILSADSLSAQAKKIQSKIVELISQHEVAPQDIVVLVANAPRKQDYYDELAALSITKPVHWQAEGRRNNNTLLLDTCNRFKGLESAVVFLWAIDDVDTQREPEILYVGQSRAKSVLYLVGRKVSCEEILENLDGLS